MDKPNRRVQRTRQLLSDALIELILGKNYASITVQDVIDRANIGRSTFYAHYHDKEDLLLSSFERVIDALGQHMEHGPQSGQPLFPSLGLFRHVQEQYELYQALVWGRGADLLFKNGQRYLSDRIEKQLDALVKDRSKPAVPTPVLANFLAGAFLTLLKWWLDNKMIYSPERMDEMFQQLTWPGVARAVGSA